MERSAINFSEIIFNARISPIPDCGTHKRLAAQAMEAPERPRLDYLRANRLVFLPFPETGLFGYFPRIYQAWYEAFKAGIVILEDQARGAQDEMDALKRYTRCAKFEFENEEAFQNAGLLSWLFLWIDVPRVALSISMSDFSSLMCSPENVEQVFDTSLRKVVDQFQTYAAAVRDSDEREFLTDLADLYSRQWALLA